MTFGISHNMEDETMQQKVRWFSSLTPEERWRIFGEFTEMILAINPDIVKQKRAEPIPGRIQVITLPRG